MGNLLKGTKPVKKSIRKIQRGISPACSVGNGMKYKDTRKMEKRRQPIC